MSIKYLFDASNVSKILSDHPNLKQRINKYIKQAESSLAFPKLKKSGREIFRILSNTHYPHVARLINNLEVALKNGWEQPFLYKTKDHIKFSSAVSELYVVTSLINKGFKIDGFDTNKKSYSVPDILAKLGSNNFSIEVYSPRDWGPLSYFKEELKSSLKNLDIPLDFKCDIQIDTIDNFDSNGKLEYYNPWDFSDKFRDQKIRKNTIENILNKVKNGEYNINYQINELNTLIKISLDNVTASNDIYPKRSIYSSLSFTGYASDFMFDNFIKRKIGSKINKGQANSLPGEHLNVLVIDISKLGYNHDFNNPFYLNKFGEIIKSNLSSKLASFDLVAFSYHGMEIKGSYPIPIVVKKPFLSKEYIYLLFGETDLFKSLSDEVLVLHGV